MTTDKAMTPEAPMDSLIARLEQATEGSRELDADIWWLVQHEAAERCFNNAATGLPKKYPVDKPIPAGLGRTAVQFQAPRYTTSVDAAIRLIPEGAAFDISRAEMASGDIRCVARLYHSDGCPRDWEFSNEAPLALTIAALKARESHR
jgi:hypothetical protein